MSKIKREDIEDAIKFFCNNSESRQRKDLYEHLNKKFNLNLSVKNYNGTNDHAKFACDEKHEVDYVMNKINNLD